jgi:hypothetical protein
MPPKMTFPQEETNVSFKYVPPKKNFSNEKGNNFSRKKSTTSLGKKGIKLIKGQFF